MHYRKTGILFSFILASVFLSGCAGKENPPGNSTASVQPAVNDSLDHDSGSEAVKQKDGDYEIKIFKNDSPLSGFGYDILNHGKVYIHQPNIPAVPGNNGFINEKDAEKTARLVLYKVKNNIMPPSIDTHELDSLKVIR
jgi:hypothetical protein